jgi:uncharacterized membrane protein
VFDLPPAIIGTAVASTAVADTAVVHATAVQASDAATGLPTPLRLVLLALLILGAAIWIGGMAAVTVLSLVSRGTLEPTARTALFRDFGRRYLGVAGPALVVTVICGAVLLIARGWDGLATAIVVVVAALIVALAFGVRQARAMRRLRQAAQAAAGNGSVDDDGSMDGDGDSARRAVTAGARRAALLRATIGLLSAAVFVLAICTAA